MAAYSKEFQVLVHDVGPNFIARPSSILIYLQETANLQMHMQQPSYDQLFLDGKVFVVSRMLVKTYDKIMQYDKIRVESWPCEGKGVTFKRCYRMFRGEQLVAEASSVWALIDRKDRRFLSQKDIDMSGYSFGEEIPLEGMRFVMPKTPLKKVGEHTVGYSEIDCNNHMNNANYPDVLMNVLPQLERYYVSEFSIRYVSEAKLGERFDIYCSELQKEENDLVYYVRTEKTTGTNVMARMVLKEI